MSKQSIKKKKCLIVYHFFAHYRLHILRQLMRDDEWDFEMISDSQTVEGIKGIDPDLSNVPLNEGGLRWEFVRNCSIFGKRLPFLWQKGLMTRLRRDDYDAVIFLGSIYFISTWVGMFKARRMEKKALFWTHGFLGKDGYFLNRIRHAFYRRADCNLLYGERAREIMEKSGFYRREQLRVIYNSLDYQSMEQCRQEMTSEVRKRLRASLFSDEALPVVVAVGRVNQVKRLDLLLRAMASLRERSIEFNCLIVGDGVELNALRELAKKLGLLKSMRFYGAAYSDDVNRLLIASDLCVIPGDVGLSAMHAMSAGLPVISHNNFDRQMPEYEAIIDGVTGAFYEYGSAAELANSIEQWLTDPVLLHSAQGKCLERTSKCYNSDYQVRIIREALL